jgi:hypothetical protein
LAKPSFGWLLTHLPHEFEKQTYFSFRVFAKPGKTKTGMPFGSWKNLAKSEHNTPSQYWQNLVEPQHGTPSQYW